MKKINRKYLFDDECSSKILDFAEKQEYFSDRKLEIRTYDDATCLPPVFCGWEQNPVSSGGVVDSSLNYIENSKSTGLFHNYTKQDNSVEYNSRMYGSYDFDNSIYCNETVLYGGLFLQQWGFALLESVARLWPIVQNPEKYKDMKIVFLSMFKECKLSGSYLQLLKLIGIKESQIIFITKPTKFKSMIIPDVCTEGGIFYTKEYKLLIERIISSAMSKESKIKTPKKIYLSRRNWLQDRDIGEDKIEKFFNKNGFVSISPEQYSVSDQINLLQNAEHIACAVSSISHSLIFAKEGIKITIINKINVYNYLQFLADDIQKLDVTYIDAYRTLFPINLGVGPFLFDVNKNLLNYAKDNKMKMPDKVGPDREDFCRYIEALFDKVEDLSDERLYLIHDLYKNNYKSGVCFYSKKELIFKKYFHKIMWKLSLGKKNFHLEKYIKYKMKLNKMKEMYYQ